MKAVDQMMPSVNIMGYYFNFKNAFINKIDKKGMKIVYDQDKELKNFTNECGHYFIYQLKIGNVG